MSIFCVSNDFQPCYSRQYFRLMIFSSLFIHGRSSTISMSCFICCLLDRPIITLISVRAVTIVDWFLAISVSMSRGLHMNLLVGGVC